MTAKTVLERFQAKPGDAATRVRLLKDGEA